MISPKKGLLSGLFLLWGLLYLIAPLHNDILVNFGASFQAEHLGSFPFNVYQAWDLRGIGNKIIYYLIKEISGIFVSYNHVLAFGIISKLVYLSLYFGISFLCINSLKPWLSRYSINPNTLKIGLAAATLSAPTFFMQAELSSIPIMLAMFALAFSDKKQLNYVSGTMLILLFSLKGVTVLYGAFVLLALLFTYKEKPHLLFRAIVSGAIFSVLGLLLYIYVIPLELLDLKNATLYQDSFSRNLHHFIGRIAIRTPQYYIYGMLHIPVLITGLWVAIQYLTKYVKQNEKPTLNTMFITLLIAIPYLYVFLQNKFFNYHYTPFMIPCILLLAKTQQPRLFLWTLIIGLITTNISILGFDHESLHYQLQRQNKIIQDGKAIRSVVSDAEPILYLYDGTLNYIVHNKSYLREFYPLPIQRSQSYWRVKESQKYKDTVALAQQFDGPYIVIKHLWFRPERHDLEKKIQDEYAQVNIDSSPATKLFKRRDLSH